MTKVLRLSSILMLVAAFVVACGGAADDAGAEAEADVAMATTDDAPAESGLSCVVMGDSEGRASPLQEVRFSYDGGEGLLCYGAPSARGREVVGGLVPYGAPWRTGANEPTTIHLSAPTSVGGVSLDAGSYSLFSIPGETGWEFVLNSNYERWGIPINDEVRASDVGSFSANPEATDAMVETLMFEVSGNVIQMSWENTRLNIPFGG